MDWIHMAKDPDFVKTVLNHCLSLKAGEILDHLMTISFSRTVLKGMSTF
jgi:hypothetical protein